MQVAVRLDEQGLEELAREVGRVMGYAPRYVSRDKLCDLMGIAPRTVKTLRARGLPAIKTGSIVFYDLEAVERWLEEQA